MTTAPAAQPVARSFTERWWAQLLAIWLLPAAALWFLMWGFLQVESREPSRTLAVQAHLLALVVAGLGLWFAARVPLGRRWPAWTLAGGLAVVGSAILVGASFPSDTGEDDGGAGAFVLIASLVLLLPMYATMTVVWALRRRLAGEGDTIAVVLIATPLLLAALASLVALVTLPDRADAWRDFHERNAPAAGLLLAVAALGVAAIARRR